MSDNPNKMNRFWQELKRRKVIYVITVYASASFVIIELINNVLGPLNLPENLSTIVIIALAIAFPIVVILSWIFDVTPQGVGKTKPVEEAVDGKKEVTSNTWRITTFASVVIIVGLVIFNVYTRLGLTDELSQYGKSIAILPFINDSQDEEDEVFITGTMVSILDRLSGIKDLRVMQRESVEQYRDTIVPAAVISERLGVSHVLRGSMRKYGDRIVINIQLIDQENNTIWWGKYDRDINDIEELFNLESKIAQEVAREIKAAITPEELKRIEKVPTTDPTALMLCQLADKDFVEALQSSKGEYMESARHKYRQALTFDSTYATAIAGLGWVYFWSNAWGDRSQETYLDSAKIYIDRSLSYDSENFYTYLLEGHYNFFLGDWTAAERSYNKTLELNPNNPVAYTYLGNIYKEVRGDYVTAIKYYEESEKRNSGELITATFYRILGHACMGTGFFDLAEEYLRNALVFDGDTANFTGTMGNLAYAKGDFNKSAELEIEAYQRRPHLFFLGLWNLVFSGQIDEANKYAKIMEENAPRLWPDTRGCLAALNGDEEKAEQLFNMFMEEFNKGAKLGPSWVAKGDGYVDAAMICVYRGQKDQAYAYLDEFMEMKRSVGPFEIHHLEVNPMFDSIREEERFQKILRKAQAGNLATHERMRLYLEETGRL